MPRDQIAHSGASALSVRAITRELGMASSAIYRYFPSRDDLLTKLIIDSYDSPVPPLRPLSRGFRGRT